jgi:PAS domain-containing protein
VIEFIYKGLGMFGIFSKKQSSVKVRKANGWGDGQAVLSAIDDGVIAIDADGNIRLINQAAESIIGWNSGDAIGLVYDSVLRIVDKDKKSKKLGVTRFGCHQLKTYSERYNVTFEEARAEKEAKRLVDKKLDKAYLQEHQLPVSSTQSARRATIVAHKLSLLKEKDSACI